MNRLQFDGAWEGDVLPAGQFCAPFPDGRIQTHLGMWKGPEWLRYCRMSPITNYVCGTRQSNGRAIEVRPDGYADVGQGCGNSAVAYAPDGALVINADCTSPYYGLGIRYISDRIYTGAETYIDNERSIYEYTTLDGITIGQGREQGVDILYNGRRYLLEPGVTTVVRFTKAGDRLAVGTFRHDIGAFVALWLHVAEIITLQDITDGPPPDPDPDPDPDPMPIPNCLSIVQDVRAKYPTPLGEQHANFLLELGRTLNQRNPGFFFGLLRKSGGTVITLPDGVTVSQDYIVCQQPGFLQGFDVLQDAEGQAVPTWNEGDQFTDLSRFYNVMDQPPPDPDPDPDPGDPTLDAINVKVTKILSILEKHFK